jgi:hypothetical protein
MNNSWVQSMELGDNSKSNIDIGPQGVELGERTCIMSNVEFLKLKERMIINIWVEKKRVVVGNY